MMDGFEALVCTKINEELMGSDLYSFMLDELNMGICEISDFVAQASNEYINENLEEKEFKCSWELIPEYFRKNKERWKYELNGGKYYKVRAVIEVDVFNDNMDSAVHEVEDCLADAKSLFRDYAYVKTLRVFSNDYDGSYEKR